MAECIGQQFGNYRLIKLLGQGGFAEVYLGEHIYLKTYAALKILQMRLANDVLESFLGEARTIASLEHPHIVRVLECGVEKQTPFLVMNYAQGGSLRQHCPRGTRLRVEELVHYTKQIASALQYAHVRKFIHRDIKPENILLGKNNEALLSDFGLVLIAQSTGSQTTQEMAGTIPYMAPEQLQGRPRPASDQYALAIVAYECLSGERPFQGSFAEIASQHVLMPPPPLYGRIAGVSRDVESVIFTALTKDPEQRFASVAAFAVALEQACRVTPYRLVNRAASGSPFEQSEQSTILRVSPEQATQPTYIVTPTDRTSRAQPPARDNNLITPQLSQPSQPASLVNSQSQSDTPTVLSNRHELPNGAYTQGNQSTYIVPSPGNQPSLPAHARGSQVDSARTIPVPEHMLQTNLTHRRKTRWTIIGLLCAILALLIVLVPFIIIPTLSKAFGQNGSAVEVKPTAPITTIITPIATHTTQATQAPTTTLSPTQIPTVTPAPTQVPVLVPTQAPTATPTASPSPTPPPTPAVPVVLAAPAQVSPASGTVFNNYPRTTTLIWNTVPGAVTYTVQTYFYQPGDTSCTGGSPYVTGKNISRTSYTFDFVGAQPGCWQVWAIDASGQAGKQSPLWEFRYTQ